MRAGMASKVGEPRSGRDGEPRSGRDGGGQRPKKNTAAGSPPSACRLAPAAWPLPPGPCRLVPSISLASRARSQPHLKPSQVKKSSPVQSQAGVQSSGHQQHDFFASFSTLTLIVPASPAAAACSLLDFFR